MRITRLLLVAMLFCVFATTAMAQCKLYTKSDESWSYSYTQNIALLDRLDLTTASTLYDEMLECFATNMSDGYQVPTNRGYGWACFETTIRSQRFFQPIKNDRRIFVRKVSDTLFALFVDYDKFGYAVHLIRRMASDTAVSYGRVSRVDVARYLITRILPKGITSEQMNHAIDVFDPQGDRPAYGRKHIDSLSAKLAKAFDLDNDIHDPFGKKNMLSIPEDCHKVGEMQLDDDLFTNYGGLEIGMRVGNWLTLRIAGSENLHFIYCPALASLTTEH